MSASAAARKPVAVPEREPRTRGFLKLEDQDCDEAYRISCSKGEFRAYLFLLRRTYSAPNSPRATAASIPEIARALRMEERSALRIMTDMAARGTVKCWAVAEAVENGLMKMPRGIDPRTNAWEPLREEWPNLPGTDEIERPAKEPKTPREAKPGGLTIAAGERMKPIAIQAEDREITARVKEGSAPIAIEVYKEDGLVEIVAFAKPIETVGTSDRAVGERKAKTVEGKEVIGALLAPIFLRLFKEDIDDALVDRIASTLGPTPLPLYEALIEKKLRHYKGLTNSGIFVVWAQDARKQYGNILYMESLRPTNGHSDEAPAAMDEFDRWCKAENLTWSNGKELSVAQDRYEEETGKKAHQ